MKPLAVVDDPVFDQHQPIGPHPERPERLVAARTGLSHVRRLGTVTSLAARDATDDELSRVHTGEYIDAIGRTAGKSGYLDADTYVSPASAEAARRAAGAAIELTAALVDARHEVGVALLRPPGHHARPHSAMGFCLVNNVAVAAAAARAAGKRKVLVLDWDVHHGNGTQEMFYDDPSVLYASIHQAPFYPFTGGRDEVGERDGQGFTVNVPLSAGADDRTYAAALDRIIVPIATEFDPDLVLISAGFDAHVRDPLASMCLTAGGFATMADKLRRALRQATPIGVVLEGGYDLTALEESLESTLTTLWTRPPTTAAPADDPPLDPRHDAELRLAERALSPYWRLG
jgi:acetoin utilization deacetylase AcuC-like enzyme